MGDAALWGGSSMAVGMAANPQEAHQAGRHQVQPPRGSTTNFRITDWRAGDAIRHADFYRFQSCQLLAA